MRREQVFWGWGEPGAGPSLPAHAGAFLREVVGVSGEVVSPPPQRLPKLPPSRLPASLRGRLPGLRDDDEIRVLRAAGKSYLDLLAMRSGAIDAPDAVAVPSSHDEVLAVLRACTEENVAVVPFGGGTSVVGGLAPLRDGHRAVLSLDLGRIETVEVDTVSLTARIGAGLRLPELERVLGAQGLTLGHFPQSFEWASVGGCVATRSSGQASTGYGRIDANVVAVRMATPLGDWATLDAPGSAAGPRMRDLIVGSEGTLGVITEATLRVHRTVPLLYDAWIFHSFQEGCDALRRLVQVSLAPAVARLSDEAETGMSMALAGGHGLKAKVGPAVLKARGYAGGCLLICGWKGMSRPRMLMPRKILRDAGGMRVGESPGNAWLASRYGGPHLRDDLLDRGVMVETLETATSWSNLDRLYRAVREALSPAHVVCHVSHLYPSGASLYFTAFAAQDRDDPAGQWRRLKDAACRAIVAAGGTITHHHAVGRDHAAYVEAEYGPLGVEVLRSVKDRVDPAGIMNPGKLLA